MLFTKASIVVGLLLGSVGFSHAQSVDYPTKVVAHEDPPQTPSKEGAETKSGSSHTISELMANTLAMTDKKDLMDMASEINKSISRGYTQEDLEYPAIDLYGEDSWSEWVNPFAGISEREIPDNYAINISDFVYPLEGIRRVNSRYGYRRRFGRMHYGVDLQVHIGDTVYAAFDGKVRIVDYERRGYGKYIVVRHPNGLETVYGHLSRQDVKPNEIVRAGDPIGLAGNTGRSTGPHLHFETRFMGLAINPEQVIDFASGIPTNEQYVFERSRYGKTTTTRVATNSRRASSDNGDIKVYRIRKGDTLSAIAKRHGTTVRQLCKLNGITTKTKLRIGKTLRV